MQPDDTAPDGPGGGGNPAGGLPDAASNIAGDAIDGVLNGLDVAAQWAGDTLRGIFGCLPWGSACDPSSVAGVLVPASSHVADLVGVVG